MCRRKNDRLTQERAQARLPAGFGQFFEERVEGDLPTYLSPQLDQRRPAAARPEAGQRREGARVSPPVLVVAVAQESAGAGGESAAAQLGERTEPWIELAQGKPHWKVCAHRPDVR